MTADDLLTSAEVAAIARVSRQTVSQWVKDGRLEPAMQLPGGAFRFRRSDVVELLTPKDSEPVEASA